MRVLHIINSLGTGGAEKILADSLQLYIEKGITVDLLLLDGKEAPFYHKLKENFEGTIFTTGVKSLYSPLQVLKIRSYLKKYHLIHVHLFPALYWVALARVVKRCNCKLVFTEHSTSNTRINNLIFRQVDKIIYKVYNRIVAITPDVKKGLHERLGFEDKKCIVICNGVNLNRINEAKSLDRAEYFEEADSVILIQVSRFDAAKDQRTIINAMKILPDSFKLLLVGEGSLRKECETLVDNLGLNERILFLGIRMDVPELLKTADIVVQSSHWEGFGLVAVEGMAAKKPVVASDVAGLREVLGDAGVLFQKGNPNDFADKVIKLAGDKHYYDEISSKCSEKSKRYSLDLMVEKTRKLYEEIL